MALAPDITSGLRWAGVIHVLDDILLPAGSLALTAEKYLLALNATKFVSLLRSANLSHYVQTSPESPTNNRSYTILAPRDDVLFDDSWSTHPRINQWDGGWTSLPPTGSEALRQVLQYHVVEGKLLPKDLEDGMLLGTELRSEKLLKGHRQRLSVTVTDSGDGSGDGGKKKKGKKGRGGGGDDDKNGNADIGFGNANVIAEPSMYSSLFRNEKRDVTDLLLSFTSRSWQLRDLPHLSGTRTTHGPRHNCRLEPPSIHLRGSRVCSRPR